MRACLQVVSVPHLILITSTSTCPSLPSGALQGPFLRVLRTSPDQPRPPVLLLQHKTTGHTKCAPQVHQFTLAPQDRTGQGTRSLALAQVLRINDPAASVSQCMSMLQCSVRPSTRTSLALHSTPMSHTMPSTHVLSHEPPRVCTWPGHTFPQPHATITTSQPTRLFLNSPVRLGVISLEIVAHHPGSGCRAQITANTNSEGRLVAQWQHSSGTEDTPHRDSLIMTWG